MKNNLVIFGDSFSTNFSTNNSVLLEESWPVLLSKKLNLNLINHSLIGACNGEITHEFFKKYKDIKNDDIVIIEIGFFNRIFEQFTGTTFMLNSGHEKFESFEIEFYKRKCLKLDTHIYLDLLKFEFICDYLTKRNIKFLIWCIDGRLDVNELPHAHNHLYYSLYSNFSKNFIKFNNEFSLMDEVVEKSPSFWINNSDKHFNKLGHEYFFLYLYDIIAGNKKII